MLTVVIPNFNHGSFLERAVTTHIDHARNPVEIIVVDDCSTDDSVRIVETLQGKHDRIRLIRRSTRGGPNAAINDGLAVASGDYVRFAGADDFASPGAGDNAIKSLEEHPAAAFSFSDPSLYDIASSRFLHIPLSLAASPVFYSPEAFAALSARNSFTISSNTVVYRREAIQQFGGFPTDFEWQADWFANLALAFRHGVCYRPEALFHFSVDPDSYGNAGVRSAEGQRRLLLRFLQALDEEYADTRELFRSAALVPEMRIRNLWWLMTDARGRRYLTAAMALRLIAREGWTHIRPLMPTDFRRWMRRQAAT